jgi:hypothetical protein
VWGDSRAALGDTIDLAAPDARVLSLVGVDGGDMAGYNVGMLDWNDDGRSDLLVCAPYANGPGNGRSTAGEVRVVYGKDRALLGTSLDLGTQSDVVIYGPSSDDEAGQSVGGGDVDGDGAADLFVGVPRAPGLSGEFEAGQVRVLFGPGPAPGSVVDLATQSGMRFYGEGTLYRSGGVVPMPFQQRAVAGLDWNGDGRDEIVIAAVQGDPGGRSDAGIVYVYYGAPRESLPAQVSLGSPSIVNLYGEGAGDWAGLCMAGADFDLDGREDLVITAPRADGPQNRTDCGAVFVVMGRPRAQTPLVWELATDADRRFIGEDDGDLTGIYALPGDVDGDTVPDLLFCGCGAMGPNNSIPIAGECYLAYSTSPLPASRPAPPALRLRLAGGHPAAGAVALVLEMPRAGEARVDVLDLQGRRVARLAEGTFGAGAHPLRWEAAGPPGLYLIVARTALGRASARAVVLK